MSNRVKNWLLGVLMAVVLVQFVILIVFFIPAKREAEIPSDQTAENEQQAESSQVEQNCPPPRRQIYIGELLPVKYPSAPEILADTPVIAHAMGGIEGMRTPNCLEGFLDCYDKGVRAFEADLRLTRDVKNVLTHDWWYVDRQEGIDRYHVPTREKFVSEKIDGSYTPLSFQDLLLLMKEYPDVCIVTDTKFDEPDLYFIQFDSLLADAQELGMTDLFDRMFIQIYNYDMHKGLENIYHFPHYIFTLYQAGFNGTEESLREFAAYCQEMGIEGITMVDSWWKPEFAGIADEYGIKLYVHTVNDAEAAAQYLQQGVAAVYTDYIFPEDVA